MQIVTLLSDFGSRDPYVSEMKGTILGLCPSANVVDISHEIEKFNTRMGAFVLVVASKYFPAGSIHLAVVDPGVGGQRRGLLIETRRGVYIGPDNGVLIPSALRDGIKEAYSIEDSRFMRCPVSSTFHGRDIFAYTAGKMACGARPSEVGPKISDPVSSISFAQSVASHDRITCEVLATDSFGNVVTTAGENDLRVAGIEVGQKVRMQVKGRVYNLDVARTYSDNPEGKAILLVGSHDFLEVAINKGNAAKRFHVRSGDTLIFVRA